MRGLERRVFVDLSFPEHPPISALDLSGFLFDINRLYTVAFKAERDPDEFDETRFRGYGRRSFRIPKRYQLDISGIRFQSPGLLVLSTALTCVTSVLTVLQMAMTVNLWPLQKKKLHLEIHKLELEIARLGTQEDEFSEQLSPRRGRPDERERIEPILSLPVTRSAITQLSENPLKPTDLRVEIGVRHSYSDEIGLRKI